MPNGSTVQSDNYIRAWCDERHARIETALQGLTDSQVEITAEIKTISGCVQALKRQGATPKWLRQYLPWIVAILLGGGGILGGRVAVAPPETVSDSVGDP